MNPGLAALGLTMNHSRVETDPGFEVAQAVTLSSKADSIAEPLFLWILPSFLVAK